LKDLGWIEGQNIVIEWRFSGGRAELLPDLAAELVRLRADLIVVPSSPTALAAKNATKTIPLVTVAVGDPVAAGLVASLARPGGNITGLTNSVGPEIAGKQLELLKDEWSQRVNRSVRVPRVVFPWPSPAIWNALLAEAVEPAQLVWDDDPNRPGG
jgi:ABC-type uncharacterized transport system substrate-binding protein